MESRYKYNHIPAVSAELSKASLEEIDLNPNVLYIEEDVQVKVLGQEIPWGISDIKATDLQQNGIRGTGIKIGVLDTGIDLEHEDLLVAGGVSFVNSSIGYDDDNGHGTHVAGIIGALDNTLGIIGALDNTLGIIGVAPEAKLYSIKVLSSDGVGYYSDIIAGIDWAINNDIKILSMSFGSNIESISLQRAVEKAEKAGLLLIAAAGNNGGYGKMDTISYPAKYKSVIAVGAVDKDNNRAFFSSCGKELELVAPGVNILSTIPEGYAVYDGTSMAAPFVTGVAALIWQQYPELTNNDIRKIPDKSVDYLGDPNFFGNGEVNALNAINYK